LGLCAEHDGDGIEKLSGQDHLVRRNPKFLEMRGFQMRRIGGCIGIHFKNFDTVRVVLLINGVQHKNPWLYANRSLYALGDGRFERPPVERDRFQVLPGARIALAPGCQKEKVNTAQTIDERVAFIWSSWSASE
jgi:hypothetical protein